MSEKKSSLGIVIPLVLVIALVAGAGLFISKGKVEEGVIDSQLASIAQQISDLSDADAGETYGLYYDPVEVADREDGRRAIIRNIRFRYQLVDDESSEIETFYEISTPLLTVDYDLLDLTSFAFTLSEVITVESSEGFVGEAQTVGLIPQNPLKGTFEQMESVWKLLADLPKDGFAIDMGERRAGRFSYGDGPLVELHLTKDALSPKQINIRVQEADLRAENFPLSLEAKTLAVDVSRNSTSNLIEALTYSLQFQEVNFGGIETPLLPASLLADVSYQGALALSFEELQEVMLNKPVYLNIHKGFLGLGDTEIEFAGLMENQGGAFLPDVDMRIDVREFAPLYDVLTEQGTIETEGEFAALAELMLQEITGVPLSEIQDASIEIKRDKDMPFTIGQTTFEELVGLWLTQKLSKGSSLEDPMLLNDDEIEDAFDSVE